jgi:hypothetical protein
MRHPRDFSEASEDGLCAHNLVEGLSLLKALLHGWLTGSCLTFDIMAFSGCRLMANAHAPSGVAEAPGWVRVAVPSGRGGASRTMVRNAWLVVGVAELA